jgi:AcrR family transcriptional regulator
MVAERAGASIGTVYRYFPDRIAVLQALAARNLERTLSKLTNAVADKNHETWNDALGAAFDVLVEAFRSEPGFRSIRVGDVIDLQPRPNERSYYSVVAHAMHSALRQRFDITMDDATAFAFEIAIELVDAMAARAFTYDRNGEAAYLEAGRQAAFAAIESRVVTPT